MTSHRPSPLELRDFLPEFYRRCHGRMTDRIAFEAPITPDYIERVYDGIDSDNPLPPEAAPPAEFAAISEELSDDYEVRVYLADSGRGASGIAISLEIIGHVADVGGVIAFSAAIASTVKRIHRKLTVIRGRKPNVSLGAAIHLAAADLIDRTGNSDFVLHGAGDSTNAELDGSYTGLDLFWIAFAQGSQIHFYVVKADGDPQLLGTIERPDPHGFYAADR